MVLDAQEATGYRVPRGGNKAAPKGSNWGHPTSQDTLDGAQATNHSKGDQNITEIEF